jgi:hypothetical protein
MDYSIFIIISLGLIAVSMPFLFKNIRDKYGITESDMRLAADMLGISIMVLQELNVKKEDKIVNYAVIIQDSFYFIINTMGDVEDLEKQVYEYSIEQLKNLDVEVNDRRKEILRILISNFIAGYAQTKNPS